MKFVIGIVVGAVLVIALADLFPTDPKQWLDALKAHRSLEEPVVEGAELAAEVVEDPVAQSPAGVEVQTPLPDRTLPVGDVLAKADSRPELATGAGSEAVEETAATEGADLDGRADLNGNDADGIGNDAGMGSFPQMLEEDPVNTESAQPSAGELPGGPQDGLEDERQKARLWTAFYSERSASGFARQLERTLGQPFGVERSGAQQYWVTYAYTEDAELKKVESHLAQAFGEADR